MFTMMILSEQNILTFGLVTILREFDVNGLITDIKIPRGPQDGSDVPI